ncbi:MAG TPA: exodeoxyribonuclease VII large subunit [Methylomirabilota bacterium]|jgi:exodeoxyribonuclease VII large subunit|nr:exodeoxyribonuclease VII large subunit [Methylomirabilota bacterium]
MASLGADPGRRVLTVSELTAAIKDRLEASFGGVWVEGEISNLRVVSAGHVYFTLKDETAQVRAVLFRSRVRRLRFAPADGLHVLAFATLDVYAARGEYQLVCEILEPKGLGALQLAFEQLKTRLAAEGLFDAGRKRPLPALPRRVGLITSPTGAAVRDFLRVITRRFADVHVVIYPVRVQGEAAVPEIVQALFDLNRLGGFDVLVVARGGGSLEDLWAFNEEPVARAIAASKVPVISAVGHETDVTIADFVADLRAPTPSAAAELVIREKAQLVAQLASLRDRLHRAGRQRVRRLGERVADLRQRRVLADPGRPLRDWHRRLDDLGLRLDRGLRRRHADVHQRLDRAVRALRPEVLRANLRHGGRLLAQLRGRLDRAGRSEVARRRRAMEALAGRLDTLSPLACLARGYAICALPSGEVVTRAAQVQPGSEVSVRLREGALSCRVDAVKPPEPEPGSDGAA